jgi:uncharacterized protein with beta-barrel porin domain
MLYRNCRPASRAALLLGAMVLAGLAPTGAVAACSQNVDLFVCTGANAATTLSRPATIGVTVGDTGTDTNASFSGLLTVTAPAISLTFADTSTASSFSGNGGILLQQGAATTSPISLTNMNAAMTLAGGTGIAVEANTTGTTTITTVAGGAITTSGDGISYSNVHANGGAATITVGAPVTTTGASSSAVRVAVNSAATTTVNVNADLVGGIYLTSSFAGLQGSRVDVNVSAGAEVSSGSGSQSAITVDGNIGSSTITNAGTISASGTNSAIRVDVNGNYTTTVLSSGTISAAATGYAFDLASDSFLFIENRGTVTGAGRSSAGSFIKFLNYGTWSPNADSAFAGGVSLDNVGTFNSGAYTTKAEIFNLGTVVIAAGGTLIGNLYQARGAATVDGTVIGIVTIYRGTLSGSGTISGDLVVTGGLEGNEQYGATLSPGNSVGTLTVTGNVSLSKTSIYRVEIQGSTADLLSVGGTATLNGLLQLVPGGGSYTFNSAYTILTAAGGVTGTFDKVESAGSFGVGVAANVTYTSNSVQVTLTPGTLTEAGSGGAQGSVFGTTQGLSQNAYSIAAAIDRAVANGADPSFLYQVYASPDRQALIAALGTLTGEVHSTVGALGTQAAGGFLQATLDPFAAGRDPNAMPNVAGGFATAGAYASGRGATELPSGKGPSLAPQFTPDRNYYVWGSILGSKSRAGGDIALGTGAREGSSGHVALGIDVRLLPNTILGVAIAAGESRSSLANRLGDAKAEVLQAGLYGMTRIGALSLGAALGYASADTETTRAIPAIGAFSIKGKYRSDIWSGRAEAAYQLLSSGGLSFSPYAAFTAQHLRTPGFVEHDGLTGLPAGLAVDGRSSTTSRGEVGVRLDAATTLFGRPTIAFGKLGWGNYLQRSNQFSASLVGLPGSNFLFAGALPDRNVALVSAGLDVKLSPRITLGGRFDGEFSRNAQGYSGSATLRVSF